MLVTRHRPLSQTEELVFSFPGCSFSRMKSQFFCSQPLSLWSFSLLEKKKNEREREGKKKWECRDFHSKCKPSPAPVFTRRSADPLSASRATVAGSCFKAKVFSRCVNTHTHTLRGITHALFLFAFFIYNSVLNNGSMFLLSSTRKSKHRQKGRLGGGGADLMRGMLSSVQHRSGPLCRDSSSSHDWLYNLQTGKRETHTQRGMAAGFRGDYSLRLESSSSASSLPHLPSGAVTW